MSLLEINGRVYNTDETEVTDMLVRLCDAQRSTISAQEQRIDAMRAANHALGTELLEASDARAAALVSLATQVRSARELTEVCVKQRDTVVTALRRLVAANEQYTRLDGDTGAARVLHKIWTEAHELLTLIDQAAAAAAVRPPG